MVSGTFHVQGQDWRYFSREKSIVHTSHFSQLPAYVTGQSVFITPVPPTGTSGNDFSFHPQPYPGITPYRGVNINNVTNNVPPLWQQGFSFNGAISGTNGFSGTFYWPNANLREVEQDWWPVTGGTFLFVSNHVTSSNSFNLMDGLRTDLFNGTAMPSQFGTILQEGDYFVQLGGDGWSNEFFVNEGLNTEVLQVTAIITIPPNSDLAYHCLPSPFFDNFTSFSTFGSVIMRLGP